MISETSNPLGIAAAVSVYPQPKVEGRKVLNNDREEPMLWQMTSFIVAVPIRTKPMVAGGRVFGEEGWELTL